MKRYEFLVVRRGASWEVRTADRPKPWAVYADRSYALEYAGEAARQKAELDGIPTGVRRLTSPLRHPPSRLQATQVGGRRRAV